MSSRLCFVVTLAAGLLATALAGCKRLPAECDFVTLPADGWEAGDTLHLTFDNTAESGDYALHVCLRTTVNPAYPYREAALELVRRCKDSIRTDTLYCNLTANGRPDDRHGISIRQHDFPIDTLHLEAGTEIHIILRHLMRRTPLPGIRDAGIRLEKL